MFYFLVYELFRKPDFGGSNWQSLFDHVLKWTCQLKRLNKSYPENGSCLLISMNCPAFWKWFAMYHCIGPFLLLGDLNTEKGQYFSLPLKSGQKPALHCHRPGSAIYQWKFQTLKRQNKSLFQKDQYMIFCFYSAWISCFVVWTPLPVHSTMVQTAIYARKTVLTLSLCKKNSLDTDFSLILVYIGCPVVA